MYSAPTGMLPGDYVGTGTQAFQSCSLLPGAHLGTQGGCPGRVGGLLQPLVVGCLASFITREGELWVVKKRKAWGMWEHEQF